MASEEKDYDGPCENAIAEVPRISDEYMLDALDLYDLVKRYEGDWTVKYVVENIGRWLRDRDNSRWQTR